MSREKQLNDPKPDPETSRSDASKQSTEAQDRDQEPGTRNEQDDPPVITDWASI